MRTDYIKHKLNIEGLNNAWLADKTAIDVQGIQDIIDGKRTASVLEVRLIAKAMKLEDKEIYYTFLDD